MTAKSKRTRIEDLEYEVLRLKTLIASRDRHIDALNCEIDILEEECCDLEDELSYYG
jgi:hypothetical protein